MLTQKDFSHLSNYYLAHEAESRGYTVEKLYPKSKRSHLKVTDGDKIAIIIGQRVDCLSYNSYFITKNKELAKQFLIESGLSTPKGELFTKATIEDAMKFFSTIKKPAVIKPSDGIWGTAVHMNVSDEADALNIMKSLPGGSAGFLIEEQSVGEEYRILATRDELLGIIHRIPANVMGDGERTIQELIDEKNSDPRRGENHEKALVKIHIDTEIISKLKKSSLELSSIPKAGEKIFLRDNSNISTGGDSVDFTDIAHPKVRELAPRIIRAIPNLPYAGFDFMTPDITKDPNEVGYSVIELNDSPMLSMHHAPYEGKSRNVSKKIIDLLFV